MNEGMLVVYRCIAEPGRPECSQGIARDVPATHGRSGYTPPSIGTFTNAQPELGLKNPKV
jgi:hypothetical protein